VRGKTRISKKGNGRIRAAMYMPAMSACSSNERMKEFYQRVNKGKSVKKIGLIAVARKLLLLMYTIWNKNEPCYNKKVCEKDQQTMRITLPSSLGKAQKKVGNSKVAYTG
ncbi:MAG: transposase, partial [Rikenellaceae bacterium]